MIDLKWIRENPEGLDHALGRRHVPKISQKIVTLDEAYRASLTQIQELQQRRNEIAEQIGAIKKSGGNAAALTEEGTHIKTRLAELEQNVSGTKEELDDLLARIPNVLLDSVPNGRDENDNVEIRKFGTPKAFSFIPKEHFELGESLGLMDFDRAAKLSGSRFTILKGPLARLERALASFMLDSHRESFGYQEVSPPLLVKDNVLFGVGQLPKMAEDVFKTTGDHYLIPTAEAPLTNLVAGEILKEESLPLRYVAHTACFRSEAGSAGKDTRGMLRQHQFYKVELVSITTPEASLEELERMTSAAESILQKLEIPYRVMALCAGDIGFASRKTYDIEVWLPGQDRYREISSCSVCGDFQARRMNARYRPKDDNKTQFVHTLNGSGVAVGRCLIAIMENYQTAEGTIKVPTALQPYMGGMTEITHD